jgi:hypothetical protein
MMFALLGIGAAIFAWLEWRRPDQRNRAARTVAACLATSALVLIGYFRFDPVEQTRKSDTEAVLFTQGATFPLAAEMSHGLRFALPRSGLTTPDVVMIPDVAYLRRHHPEIRHVRLEGAGLEPFELEALEGVRVSIGDRPSAPSITFLHVPRQVALGAPVEVQGRLNGPNAGERIEISLESPDGTNTTTSVAGDGNAGAPFKLTAASPAAEGRFVWRLKMSRGGGENAQLVAQERIGISVVKPALPRVLALDGAPALRQRICSAGLRKWAAASGRARLSALIDIALPPRAKERRISRPSMPSCSRTSTLSCLIDVRSYRCCLTSVLPFAQRLPNEEPGCWSCRMAKVRRSSTQKRLRSQISFCLGTSFRLRRSKTMTGRSR